MSDSLIDLVVAITNAFAAGRVLRRKSLVFENDWETESLMRDLKSVGNQPNERFVEAHFSSLPAFTAEGLRHVLPQYLIYSLKHPMSDATERVIFHLAPVNITEEYWRARLAVFTPVQKQVICEYLRFMQAALVGEDYEEYLARGLTVWGCG